MPMIRHLAYIYDNNGDVTHTHEVYRETPENWDDLDHFEQIDAAEQEHEEWQDRTFGGDWEFVA